MLQQLQRLSISISCIDSVSSFDTRRISSSHSPPSLKFRRGDDCRVRRGPGAAGSGGQQEDAMHAAACGGDEHPIMQQLQGLS